MTPIPISDADDPRIEAYRSIRERDLVRRDGRFIAEGTSVLNVLARQKRFAIESALILENRLAGVRETLEQLGDSVPVYTATRDVIDAIAGFPMHRGVLAIGQRDKTADTAPALSSADKWQTAVALSGLANHDNVGAIFRNAVALGADAVLMDQATCDPLYRKALRVSVGSVLILPWHRFETTATMLNWLENASFGLAGLSPDGSVELERWHLPKKVALVLGAEGPGLDDATMARLQTVRIAMGGDLDSLNVATSAALALHEIRRRRAR